MQKLISLFILFFISSYSYSQTLEAENVYEISNKANRGYLGNIALDEAANEVALTFVTKANDNKAKFETYRFDATTYAFKEVIADEIEFEKATAKYKWFKYKGENYTLEAVTIEKNLTGTLVLKRKQIDYFWNWFWGGYDRDVMLLEKLKPKSDEGNKFYAWDAMENELTGDVLVLVGPKAKIEKGADPYAYMKNFSILKITKDLDIVKETKIDFQYPMMPYISQPVATPGGYDEGGEQVSDWGIVFVPAGGTGLNKIANPEINDFTFVRITPDNNIADKISFKPEKNLWGIQDIITVGKDIYLIGPAKLDDKYLNQVIPVGTDEATRNTTIESMKWESFQLMKISGGKISWLKATDISEFEAKLKTPPSQKKAPSYDGKKFAVVNFIVAKNGDMLIMGQNFEKGSEGARRYTDPIMFHFNNDGSLKAQYGIRREENNKYAEMVPAGQEILWSADLKDAFWMILEIQGIRAQTELKNPKLKALIYPSVAKINLGSGDVGDFALFGSETYFLHNEHPFLPTSNSEKIVFFGESKDGRNLWFARMPLN